VPPGEHVVYRGASRPLMVGDDDLQVLAGRLVGQQGVRERNRERPRFGVDPPCVPAV